MNHILSRRDGNIGIIEFDNPEGGFLTAEMVVELDRVTREWERDQGIRAIVLTGNQPGTFITHYSPFELATISAAVKTIKSQGRVRRLRKTTRRIARLVQLLQRIPPLYRLLDRIGRRSPLSGLLAINRFHNMLSRWQVMNKVVIAAINGHAMGGGFEIALASDFRLMAHGDYALGLPEAISAIIPGAGGTQRLARLIGANRAVELILTGHLCKAAEAEQLGLISKAVSPQDLWQESMDLAKRLAGQSPLAVAGVKRSIHLGSDLPMRRALELEALNFLDACLSTDAAAVGDYYLGKLEKGHHPTEIFDELRQGGVVEFRGN